VYRFVRSKSSPSMVLEVKHFMPLITLDAARRLSYDRSMSMSTTQQRACVLEPPGMSLPAHLWSGNDTPTYEE